MNKHEQTEVKAKYTSKRTALLHGLDIQSYADELKDYGLELDQTGRDSLAIRDIDPDSLTAGDVVDVAQFILLYDPRNREWLGELVYGEMTNTWTFGDIWTTSDELDIPGFPLHIARALKA